MAFSRLIFISFCCFQSESYGEEISFRKILDVFNSNSTNPDENQRIVEDFRTKPFGELKSRVNEKQRQADQRIGQLLSVLHLSKDTLPLTTATTGNTNANTNHFNYPELFTY